MEYCEKCACSCKPISLDCISKYTDIYDVTVIQANHYAKATLDLEDLIGVDCADELCDALTAAYEQLEASTDPNASIEDFLPQQWLDILKNKYFQMWYANKLLWHFLHGASISEVKSAGLVTTSNNDADYKNDYQHAEEDERRRMQTAAKFYADAARNKFIDLFWCHAKHNYSCAELDCGCNKRKKCETHCETHCDPCHDNHYKKRGIGIDII